MRNTPFSQRNVATRKVTFKGAYGAEEESYIKWLTLYLEIVGQDTFWSNVLKFLISGAPIDPPNRERIVEMMAKVDLDILLVENMLGDEKKSFTDEVYDKIVFAISEGKNRLKGWDGEFIFGKISSPGTSLMDQYQKRKMLSAKQMKQLDRICSSLGYKNG